MSSEQNQQALAEAMVLATIHRRDGFCSPLVYMDMDSVHLKAHGNQLGARRNGHKETRHSTLLLLLRGGGRHTGRGSET